MNSMRIKQARLKLGITQKELALRVGLSQAEVSRKENGITSSTWICPFCGMELVKEPLKNTDGSPVKFNNPDKEEQNTS